MKVLNLTVREKPFFTQQLDALAAMGVDHDVLTVPGERVVDEDDVQRHSVLDYVRFYPKVVRQSLGSYDVVHAHFGLTAPFALAQPRRPVVTSLWGWDLNGEYGWLSKRCARLSDAVLVRNEEMAEKVDCPAHVIERGVDLDMFAPTDKREAQQAAGWDPEAFHVLFPYSPSREKKNYPLAEAVVAEVDGEFDRPVEIHAVYNEPHGDVPVYMNAADALLMTSESEGSPNTVKEALACDLPVVATDVGDVEELVADVGHSFVCRSKSDLVANLATALQADREGYQGRAAIENLTWESTANSVLDVYESLI